MALATGHELKRKRLIGQVGAAFGGLVSSRLRVVGGPNSTNNGNGMSGN